MQYDLNGRPILRIGDSTSMVTQKNGDGTTTLWRAGVMYLIPAGDIVDPVKFAEAKARIKAVDDHLRTSTWRVG